MRFTHKDFDTPLGRLVKKQIGIVDDPVDKPPLKYRNKPTNGYASRKEAERAAQLQLIHRAGDISDLKEQVRFKFEIEGMGLLTYASGRPVEYVADFTYIDQGKTIVEDVKSEATSKDKTYKLKKALMKWVHGIEILET